MDTPFERWQPDRDPIHRFIHVFDMTAGMVACHRWRPVALVRPEGGEPDGPCPPLDAAAHSTAIESGEHSAALADAAVAAYARLGQPTAEPTVAYAAKLKAMFYEAYRLHPCPCQLCPNCGKSPRSHPCELALSVDYMPVRRALLRHLALGGKAVPRYVRMRGVRLAQLLRADDPPPGPHAVLRLTVAEILCWVGPPGGWRERTAELWERVDEMAGPVGTAVRAGWSIQRDPDPRADGNELYRVEGDINGDMLLGPESAIKAVAATAAGGTSRGRKGRAAERAMTPQNLRSAYRAILAALRSAGKPLMGKVLASASGYKPGTLRRHTKPLQDAGLIRRTPDGYELTPAGLGLIDAVIAHMPVT